LRKSADGIDGQIPTELKTLILVLVARSEWNEAGAAGKAGGAGEWRGSSEKNDLDGARGWSTGEASTHRRTKTVDCRVLLLPGSS
jgi:hypothetical protein